MSLGPKSNFIPVIYAGAKKKKRKRKKLIGENPNDGKIQTGRTCT